MADYGTYYTSGIFKDKEGEELKLDIQKDNYYGDPKKLIYINPESLDFGTRGGKDQEYSNVQGSELNLSLYSQNIECLKDNFFDNAFKIWHQKYNESYPWFFKENGDMYIEVDGGDSSAYLYQTCYLQQGEGYELHISLTLFDNYDDNTLELRLENDSITSFGQSTQTISILGNESSGVFDYTMPFTATSYFTKVGLVFTAGGANINFHSISLKKKRGINFDELMLANYQEFKTVLTHFNKKFINADFKEQLNTLVPNVWLQEETGSNWSYNHILKCAYSGADGLDSFPTKILSQEVSIQRLQKGKVKLKFGCDNDVHNSQLILRFWEDDGFWTDRIIFSGTSPSHIYTSIGTTVLDTYFDVPTNQQVYTIEYNLSESHFISMIGARFRSYDEGFYIYYFDTVLEDTLFSGFVKPDNIVKRFRAEQYFIDVNAIDGLADLKNIPYENDGTRATSLSIIREILAKTGHIIPLSIQNGIQNIDATTIWYNINLDRRKFIEEQKGKIKYKNCYEVLEMILKPFFCKLTFSNGEWLIQNHNEVDSYRLTYYDAINPALYYGSTHNRKVSIDALMYSPDSDELSKIAPIKSISIEVDNQFNNDCLNRNSDFLFNLNHWNNFLSNWTTFQRIDDDGRQFLRCRRPNPLPIGNNFFSADQMIIIPRTRYRLDRLKFSVEVANISAGATNLLRCQLVYGDGTGAYKDIPLSGYTAEFEKAEYEFPPQYSPTNNHIITVRFGVMNNGSNSTAIECYFDNPKLEIDWSSDPNDKTTYYIESGSANPLLEELEETISFADIEYTNDNSGLGYSVSATTTSWKNYDNSITGVPLAELFGTERLRSNYTYKDYIKCSVYDPKITVKQNSIIQLNGKNYKTLGYWHNIFNGLTEIEAVEHKIDDVGELEATYIKAYTAFE